MPKKLTKKEMDLIHKAESSGEPEVVEKARALEMYK